MTSSLPDTAPRPRLFGTDGIRGPAGRYPLDESTVTRLGRVLGEALRAKRPRPRVVLGGDTRDSTAEICAWLATGLGGGGAEVLYAGTVPTPAISYLTGRTGAACGVAVSASHNLHPDNGIKLVDGTGAKWTPVAEHALERLLEAATVLATGAPAEPVADPRLAESYLDFLAGQLDGERPLEGLRTVLDTAHGAASRHAERLFTRLGARVEARFDRPDGRNINRGCGSTHPETMAAATAEGGHDLGLAFDGDADRVIWADETGRVRDGDALLYLWASELVRRGELEPRRVVATTMSNMGLEKALAAIGVEMVRCPVGDRAVAETMRREGIVLGGEQSGHVIHSALAPTGDGLQSGLHLAAIAVRERRPLSELLKPLRRFPQTLLNVRVRSKPELESVPSVAAGARRVVERLGDRGRLVLRYSGTEPLARVMIEGEDGDLVRSLARELAETIRAELGDG